MAHAPQPVDPLVLRQREAAQPHNDWSVFDRAEDKPPPPIPPLTEREAADPWLRAMHDARVAQRAVEDQIAGRSQGPHVSKMIFALPLACLTLIIGMIAWPIRRRQQMWKQK